VNFEGEAVDGCQIVIRQFRGDIELPLAVDEVVDIVLVARVKSVGYEVNERTGHMHRVHIMKVEDVKVKV
jgi:hypothetical protein